MITVEGQEGDGSALGSIIADSKDLLSVGEEGIAFENMVENLYEIDFPINKAIFNELEKLCELLCLESKTLDNLAAMVTD